MTTPGAESADLAVAQTEAIVENADKLGLTWGLRPATVVAADPLLATYDGDTEPISMTSMTGALSAGERVYAIRVPPSGNYIIGRTMPQPLLRARCSAGNVPGSNENIPYDVVDEDVGWSAAATPFTIITIPEDGVYEFSAVIIMASGAVAGSRQDITLDFTSTLTGWTAVSYRGSWSNGGTIGTTNALIRLNAGDSFLTSFAQTSFGGGVNYISYITCARKSG